MRVKTRWHDTGRARPPAQLASVAAATVWRIAHQGLKNLQSAAFSIEAGPRYFQLMTELVAFLVQVSDRIAYQRLASDARLAFTTALVRRLSEITEDNQRELLGEAGETPYRAAFISTVNRRSDEYAAFGFDNEAPDYDFRRHLANCLAELMEERDRTWVHDQVMEVETPEAVKILTAALVRLFAQSK